MVVSSNQSLADRGWGIEGPTTEGEKTTAGEHRRMSCDVSLSQLKSIAYCTVFKARTYIYDSIIRIIPTDYADMPVISAELVFHDCFMIMQTSGMHA